MELQRYLCLEEAGGGTYLKSGWTRGNDITGLFQGTGSQHLPFRRDHFGPSLPCGFCLRGHGSLQLHRKPNVLSKSGTSVPTPFVSLSSTFTCLSLPLQPDSRTARSHRFSRYSIFLSRFLLSIKLFALRIILRFRLSKERNDHGWKANFFFFLRDSTLKERDGTPCRRARKSGHIRG